MLSTRFLPHVIVTSLLVGLVGCGGTTQYEVTPAFAIAGTPPPPPAPPPPPPKEEPKPPPRVELRDNKIEIKEKIQFEVNKAVIKPESFGLLKEIGDVIKNNPQVKKLSIEGHASSEGDAKANKKLSDDRAKSVMDYLVKKEGIKSEALVAKGWGIEKPIADNASEDGREKNRRVEFLVVEQDVTKKKVEIDPTTGKEKVIEEQTHSIKPIDPAAEVPKKEAGAPAGAPKMQAKPDAKKQDAAKKPAEAAKKPEEKK